MRKFRKALILCIVIFMVMQVVLPTISQAVNLNKQSERPYNTNNDDDDELDIYTVEREENTSHTIFKIGEVLDAQGNLNFETEHAYYCLRADLGFGDTDYENRISNLGINYSKFADLTDKETIMNYFKETIGYDIPEANYNAICWLADNIYLPKSEYANEMKEDLLEAAGITSSLLTDDDIEVVQQLVIWYFTNNDQIIDGTSVVLPDTEVLANLLQIDGVQPNNDTTVSYNKNRADQINTLYRYLVDNAKKNTIQIVEKTPQEIELDDNLKATLEIKTVSSAKLPAFVVGPFKINKVQEGNIEGVFSYSLKYKTSEAQEEWSILELDNVTNMICLSDANGNKLDRAEDIEDMIAGDAFYITILKDISGVSNIAEFELEVKNDSYYYNTIAEILTVTAEDQPVLKVEKEKIEVSGTDKVTVKPEKKVFDLALRKYISNIERKGVNVEIPSREPNVDTETLKSGTYNRNGNLEYTATYTHPKNVLTVKQGDIITYTLRIYNEGELDGYATEITDYLPEGLGFLNGYSGNGYWSIQSSRVESKPLVGEKGYYKTEEDVPTSGILDNEDLSIITIVTGKEEVDGQESTLKITNTLLKDSLIKKYDDFENLDYKEVEVTCIVLAPNTYEGTLVNVAEISKDKAVDETGAEVTDVEDRDSTPDSLTEEQRKSYEDTPWYNDDDDYETVQLKYFDLALRKFITGVNETEVTTRIPEFKIDDEGNYVYEHDKTPVEVVDNDKVTYTIRVFNEGTIAGYAEEVEDDIPAGLIFLPEDETNKKYGWKMYYYDEEGVLVETEKAEEATVIRTTYLSEENDTLIQETGKNSNLLELFNKETIETPDYRDLKVVFKVSQEDIPEENEDGIITNKAHITADSDDDEDSNPDEWNDGEDDQDTEKVYVQKFDLALFKWVTQTIVTVDGKTTTTETGFEPNVGKTEASGEGYRDNSEEEPIASVTIDKKKLNDTVVKFVYNIKVVNEGDLEGFATEITDYIPGGLKFVAEDNPLWTLAEDGKITTRALETKLLKPGESAEVPVTFTWINDSENLGLKTNIAAITEDYNEKGVSDEDSTPENEDIPNYEKEQEDDDDFALVILTLKTGNTASYIWLIFVTISIILAGAILIKKYVL